MFGGVQWGTVGEWFAGAGGVLAVAVAGYFGWQEHKRAAEERDRRHQLEAEAKETALRDRARLLSIWRGGASFSRQGAKFTVNVHSSAELPFRNVVMFATWPDEELSNEVGIVRGNEHHKVVEFGMLAGRNRNDRPTFRVEYDDPDDIRWSQDTAGHVQRAEP